MLKSVSVAALCLSVALPALAEDKKQNVMVGTSGTPGAVSQMELAQQLYAVGVANSDALTVLTAAKLAAGVELKDTDRKKETKGDAPAEDAEGSADAPVDAAAMLAKAKELAGEDETLVGLVEDAEAEGSRGRIGGASSTLSRLPAGMTDVWEIPFYGESYAEIGVLGDGDSNLDVLITDENGNTVCYDVSWSDKVYCDFTPAWNGYFYVTVQNTGSVRNSYYLMTN
jgi:hypothetical protein